MIRVVLDTNVVVSAHIKPDGLEDRVFKLVLNRRIEAFVSQPILEEYRRVLNSAKLSLNKKRVRHSLSRIRRVANYVEPPHELDVCPDKDDNRFLECAETSGADYVVTGNKRHFPARWRNTRIVNARELIERIYPDLKR